jgi:glutamine cyclotransferase
MNNLQLDPRLQKLIDLGESGTDILHGELKNLMLEAEQQLDLAQEAENLSEEAMDSMERRYWEGILDAYSVVYQLTYELAFAISDRSKNA